MTRLIRAELFKLRTINIWWLFGLATLISTTVTLVINCVNAYALLKPLDRYLYLHSHDHVVADIPPEFLARMQAEWALGHDPVTQAATVFTSGQLIGVLLTCLLGIVLITSEYYHQTATTTFLLTPRRTAVVVSKLATAVLMAGLAWLVSTVVSVLAGAIYLHTQGFGSQLGHWVVIRALLLNLTAYANWAVFGVGLGALIRSQLGATVTATVLYLAGAAAGGVLRVAQHVRHPEQLGAERAGHRSVHRIHGDGLSHQDVRREPTPVGRSRRPDRLRDRRRRRGQVDRAPSRHRVSGHGRVIPAAAAPAH
jgi:hypothetical protein